VQVCKENPSHFAVLDLHLGKSLEAATTDVKKQFLLAGFDEDAWSKTIDNWRRTPSAQESYLDDL
jgi:hypothetical protein